MIEHRYLLVIMLPTYVDETGKRFLDELWHKDLIEHLDQIRHITLAAPRRAMPDRADARRLIEIDESTLGGRLTLLDLPPCRNTVLAVATSPIAATRLWKAIGSADIVHINIGGWPISYGWIAGPMAKLRGRFLLTNIESAGWRMWWRRPWRPHFMIRGAVYEVLGRFCANISDLVTSTQATYLREILVPRRQGRGHVVGASWINEETVLPRDTAERLWESKLRDGVRPLRTAYIGNLLPAKGIAVMLDALRSLDRRGVPVSLDVYGKGEMADACVGVASHLSRSVSIAMRGTLAYGPSFFEMLRGLDVVLIPSLSDEQPRIVYDCFSQAVPVIASDTPGLIQCVTDGRDGKLVPTGDADALTGAITWAAANRPALRDLGIASLDTARSLTHQKMHARRAEIIQHALTQRSACS